MKYLLCSLLILSHTVDLCQPAKILIVIPIPSYSHFIAGEVIAKQVAKKGHEVTVVSAHPQKTPIKNYRDIELTGLLDWLKEQMGKIALPEYENRSFLSKTMLIHEIGYEITKLVLNHVNVENLIKSGESFDVVIVEHFACEPLFGLCHFFKAPCVAFSTIGPNLWNNRLSGNVALASYIPSMISFYSPKMSFFERLHNLFLLCFQELVYHLYAFPKLDKLMHQHIPNSPNLSELVGNISLVLLNSHPALTTAVPITPNMIEIGGVHVQGLSDVKLPGDVQKFLDDNDEGVVYFALGSNFKSKDLPPGKLEAVVTALKKFGKPILWKFEDELPEKIENIKIASWFPQTAVLGTYLSLEFK